MGRRYLLAGLIALLAPSAAHPAYYIPGQTRNDGLYVPPHFRGAAGDRHAAEEWFDRLVADTLREEQDKLPPAAAGAPPAPPLPPDRRP